MAADSIRAKWPDPLLKWGFVPVARVFLRNYRRLSPPLTSFQAILVVNALDYAWSEDRLPYPTPDQLAGDLGVKVEVVEKNLLKLRANGYLRRLKTADGRVGLDFSRLHKSLTQLIVDGKNAEGVKAWIGKRTKRKSEEDGE